MFLGFVLHIEKSGIGQLQPLMFFYTFIDIKRFEKKLKKIKTRVYTKISVC